MKVCVARETGFCRGVRLAVEVLEQALAEGAGPVQVLGSLIHNQGVVRGFEARGVRLVADPAAVNAGVLVLPSHGVPPEAAREVEARGIRVIDVTCSLVRRAQLAARELTAAGYQVVVVGDPGHAEVVSIAAWTGGLAAVVRDEEEAAGLPAYERVGVVAQTTQRPEVVERVVAALAAGAREVRLEDTLCPVTRRRQQEAHSLAKKVDLMLVVGGRESANTRRLVEVAREAGGTVHHIETHAELDPRWFDGVKRVGVTAGTSTPDRAIEEVLARMKEMDAAAAGKKQEEEHEANQAEALAGTEAAADPQAVPAAAEEAPPPEQAEAVAGPEEEVETATVAGEAELPGAPAAFNPGDVVQGRVVAIEGTAVLVDIGAKSEGIVPANELAPGPVPDPAAVVKVGDEITVTVLGVDEKDGTLKLSKRRADTEAAWNRLQQAFEEGSIVEAPISAQVKGGLIADVGVRGFIPASHVGLSFIRDLKPYLGRTLQVRVIELDREQRRVVLSERSVLEEGQARQEQEVWSTLEEGRVVTGTVKRLADFGAFVDLGGIDGLLHVSELTWGRVNHPRDVVREGQEIQCKVLKLDRERRRISLGLKQLESDPWQGIESKYPPGAVAEGTVVSLAAFGAFVELEPGVEGLVHVSQLSDRRIERPDQVVKVGGKVRVKVLKLAARQKRLSLSLKEAEQDAERATMRKYMAEQEGDRVTLGEVFGDLFTEREKVDEAKPELSEPEPSEPERSKPKRSKPARSEPEPAKSEPEPQDA